MIVHDASVPAGGQPGGVHATLDQAIEFVNTTGLSKGRPFEELATSGLAVHWLTHMGVLDQRDAALEIARFAASAEDAQAALERLRRTRAGMREVIDAIDAGRAPALDALADLNATLGIGEVTQLVMAGGSLRVVRRCQADPFDEAIAALARALADAIGDGRQARLRICGNDRCRWAFYDRSRPGTRRWCEMSSCGNRMKAARHRAKLREGSASLEA